MVGCLQIPVRLSEQGGRAGKSLEQRAQCGKLPPPGILQRLFEPGFQSIHGCTPRLARVGYVDDQNSQRDRRFVADQVRPAPTNTTEFMV